MVTAIAMAEKPLRGLQLVADTVRRRGAIPAPDPSHAPFWGDARGSAHINVR